MARAEAPLEMEQTTTLEVTLETPLLVQDLASIDLCQPVSVAVE